MEQLTTSDDAINWQQQQREKNQRIALVATMGNLHKGHLALIKQAKKLADKVVVSIFVNPLQFSPAEDYQQYPRTLAADMQCLNELAVDALFLPSVKAMYPHDQQRHTQVFVPEISQLLCGVSRPHFFQGVTTVVLKLLNILRPHVAIFGKKDYQQYKIIQQMVKDLHVNVEIIAHPIIRESDGLAMSSRNRYLSVAEREIAPFLQKQLQQTAAMIEKGNTDYLHLMQQGIMALKARGFVPDYFTICRREDLRPAHPHDQQLIVFAAAYLGRTRLIDNVICDKP